MSYTHCPTCQRAFNLAISAACPYCPVPAVPVDASEDIVAAAELLARAMTRATPAERSAAAARLDRIALPAPNAAPAPLSSAVLRQIRATLAPPVAADAPTPRPLLATIAFAVLARLESRPRLRGMLARVRALAA
ncbi:MAG TPA: hypothetical protein VMJ10_27650 [Kofleriaceae bacterium]|nr:hypothetical protein [Kofleriaceae bacterium]